MDHTLSQLFCFDQKFVLPYERAGTLLLSGPGNDGERFAGLHRTLSTRRHRAGGVWWGNDRIWEEFNRDRVAVPRWVELRGADGTSATQDGQLSGFHRLLWRLLLQHR